MMSAKDAKKKTEEHGKTLNEKVIHFLGNLEAHIKTSIEKGESGIGPFTFPWTQIPRDILNMSKKRLEDLKYTVDITESNAYQNFTITVKW